METAQVMERSGEDIIHLEVGEPDFDTPDCIKEAAIRALRDGKTHYTDSRGLWELREAICAHYFRTVPGQGISGSNHYYLRDLAGHVYGLFGPAGARRRRSLYPIPIMPVIPILSDSPRENRLRFGFMKKTGFNIYRKRSGRRSDRGPKASLSIPLPIPPGPFCPKIG